MTQRHDDNDFPMGPVSFLKPGESFTHDKVKVTHFENESVGGELTDGSGIEPLYSEWGVVLPEPMGETTAHVFYHPLTMQGIAVIGLPTETPKVAVRSVDLSGSERMKPLIVEFDDAEPAGVDEQGRIHELLKNDIEWVTKPDGTVEVSMPTDQVPEAFRRRFGI